MGFGIGDIVGGVKNAVGSAANAVGQAASAVGDGASKVQEKVSETVRSALDAIGGASGFDGPEPVQGPVAESKPKGTGGNRADSGNNTSYA